MLYHRWSPRILFLSCLFVFLAVPAQASGYNAAPSPISLAITNSQIWPAASVSFQVNTTLDGDDQTPGDGICAAKNGLCTLRAAVTEANRAATEATIFLPAGKFEFTATPWYESAHLVINQNMKIQGVSPEMTVLDGSAIGPNGHNLPIFHAIKDLSLSRMTLKNGWFYVSNTTGYDIVQVYGAVTARNQLILDEMVITENQYTAIFAEPLTNAGVPVTVPNVIITNTAIINNPSGGVYVNRGHLTMVNSTVSDNYSVGIEIHGSASINNSTITGNWNQAVGVISAGGIYHTVAYPDKIGTITLSHTIVAGNSYPGQAPDCRGTIISAGYNLIGDTTLCDFQALSSDLLNMEAKLAPLAQNGGLTPTHALLPNSPALDAGNPTGCGVIIDQRGFPRPADTRRTGHALCDIGAYEVENMIFMPTLYRP